MTSLVLTLTETMRYKGALGQWSWVLHRITGLGVVFFLVLHVIDTSWSVFYPQLYVEAIATYIALVSKGRLLCGSAPENLLKEIENKVWEWTISSEDLPALKQKHIISGTIRRSNGLQVRVVSVNKPVANAQMVSPNLEDAYLFFIGGKQ